MHKLLATSINSLLRINRFENKKCNFYFLAKSTVYNSRFCQYILYYPETSINRGSLLTIALCLMTFSLLGSCSNHIKISPKPLTPLVEPLHVPVGLITEKDFKKLKVKQRNAENTRTRRTFIIGPAQHLLFTNLIDAISGDHRSTPTILVKPVLSQYKVSDPVAGGSAKYEVWLTYKIMLHNTLTNQQEVWVLQSYGAAKEPALSIENASFNKATQKAIRQFGTLFLTQYRKRNIFQQLTQASVQ